jgi:hypothetical protein
MYRLLSSHERIGNGSTSSERLSSLFAVALLLALLAASASLALVSSASSALVLVLLAASVLLVWVSSAFMVNRGKLWGKWQSRMGRRGRGSCDRQLEFCKHLIELKSYQSTLSPQDRPLSPQTDLT